MSVPYNDLLPLHKPIWDELDNAFHRVVDSHRFVKGPQVEEFEKEWAAYCGAPYAVGVSSGTSALELLLKTLIDPGDYVIVPAMTFQATAEAVVNVGAHPIFVDVDSNGQINTETLEYAIDNHNDWHDSGKRIKAVIIVHLWGHVVNTPFLKRVLNRISDVHVIEDCAQVHGGKYVDGNVVGSLDWTDCAWSFFPGKNLGAFGDAGAVTMHNLEVYDAIRSLRNHGRLNTTYRLVGTNARMDEIQAAVLRVKLKYLDGWNQERRKLAMTYHKSLYPLESPGKGFLWTQSANSQSGDVYHVYSVTCRGDQKRRVLSAAQDAEIELREHYSTVIPYTPPFREVHDQRYPEAEFITQHQISLPLFPGMTHAQQTEVIDFLFHQLQGKN